MIGTVIQSPWKMRAHNTAIMMSDHHERQGKSDPYDNYLYEHIVRVTEMADFPAIMPSFSTFNIILFLK